MRHRKNTVKLGRTGSHKRSLFANMLKSLIEHERMVTTVAKAKELRSLADQLVTLAKEGTLAARREVIGRLMIRYNPLTSKEQRLAKQGDTSAYNIDRRVVGKLFDTLGPRFANRAGGYTRLVKGDHRRGDDAQECIIEFLAE